jgi:Tol biopolymer transport system component
VKRSCAAFALCLSALAVTCGAATPLTRSGPSGSATQRVGNDSSSHATLTPDGRYVVFESDASDLVIGDTNAARDIFLRDRVTGTTERVNLSTDGQEAQAEDFLYSYSPSVSADGRFIAFISNAENLAPNDTNGQADTFVRDRQSGITERVSVSSSEAQGGGSSYDESASISSDGRFVVFSSRMNTLVPGDTNDAHDIFVRDRELGTTERISLSSSGAEANDASVLPTITPDGRWVAFISWADNLVPGDTNRTLDVFLRDRDLGTTERVSLTNGGKEQNGRNYNSIQETPRISVDGRFVFFGSTAKNLVAGDRNDAQDLFVRDRALSTTTRVSVKPDGTKFGHGAYGLNSSPDGRFFSFLGTNGVFLGDRLAGTVVRIPGFEKPGIDTGTSVSADGSLVTFDSSSARLIPGDTNGRSDVLLANRAAAGFELVSVALSPGSVRVSPTELDFPELRRGKRARRPVYLRNAGPLPATVEVLPPKGPFRVSSPTPIQLLPGQRKTIWVIFEPKTTGFFSERLVLQPLELGKPTMMVRLWGIGGPIQYAPAAPPGSAEAAYAPQ